MGTILLKQQSSEVTLIKNTFIDNYMINANGEYVKIYLYLLRCLGDASYASSLTTERLADVFDCTERDILRAFRYWEHAGLLSLDFQKETLHSIQINECAVPSNSKAPSAKGTPANSSELQETSAANTAKYGISSHRMKQLIDNKEIKELLGIAQAYMGKTLNSTETETILFFYDQLGFSADLIDYLLEYCATNNHKAFRYIEKVGIAWHEAGITSRSQAKEYVSSFSNTYFSILKAFGISGRTPAQTEKAFIDKWQNVYGFSLDVILEACNRTINTIHQPSFKYADSILCRWKEKGVKSLGDLHRLDLAHEKQKKVNAENVQSPPSVKKNAFNNFPQREYDFGELEKQLLKRS